MVGNRRVSVPGAQSQDAESVREPDCPAVRNGSRATSHPNAVAARR
jgi:hypothetical protein